MPQPSLKYPRKVTGGLAMAMRWQTIFTLSWVPRKSYGGRKATAQLPYNI